MFVESASAKEQSSDLFCDVMQKSIWFIQLIKWKMGKWKTLYYIQIEHRISQKVKKLCPTCHFFTSLYISLLLINKKWSQHSKHFLSLSAAKIMQRHDSLIFAKILKVLPTLKLWELSLQLLLMKYLTWNLSKVWQQ